MSSTISAGTTSGTAIAISGDTSGQLVLQTNGTTTAVTISTGQVVTLAQPLPVASGGSGVTTSTGTGANVLGTSPTITGAVMSTMASSVITSGTTVSPTASTSIDFTSIPSWVKRITVMFYRPTTNGSSIPLIQLGTTSGIETTGYIGYSYNPASSVTSTAGATLAGQWGSTWTINGIATICLLGSNVWAISFTGAFTGGNTVMLSGYSKTVAATLDRVRITTVNGSDVYNSGSVNILYE